MFCSNKLCIFYAKNVFRHVRIGCLTTSTALFDISVPPPDHQVATVSASVIMLAEKQRRDRMLQISDAMLLYMKATQEKRELLEEEKVKYSQGKRHLANIMGYDPETINEISSNTIFDVKFHLTHVNYVIDKHRIRDQQDDVDKSIQYLFPSGLYSKQARPKLKPPEKIFPSIDKVDVDATGAPKHTLFFTTKPKFYTLLSQINKETQNIAMEIDRRQLAINMGERPDDEEGSREMLTRLMKLRKEFGKNKSGTVERFKEPIKEAEVASLMTALEYLANLINVKTEELEEKLNQSEESSKKAQIKKLKIFRQKIPKVEIDKLMGRRKVTAYCMVKKILVKSVVREGGTGEITVNGHRYDEFRSLQAREIMLAPMIIAGKLGHVDVDSTQLFGSSGLTVIPRAVRQGIALGLAALYPETAERLNLAGLLSFDPRKKERKKINQPGARAKWIWKKR